MRLNITLKAQEFIKERYQNIRKFGEKRKLKRKFEPAVFTGSPISISLYDIYKIGDIEVYVLKDTFSSVEVFLVEYKPTNIWMFMQNYYRKRTCKLWK